MFPGIEFWDFLVCLLQHCYQCQIVLASDFDIYVIKSISLPQRRIPRPNVKIIIENSFSAFLNRHLLVLVTEYCSLQTRKTSMYTELHCISCGDISIQFLYCPTNVLSVYCTVAAKCCRELPSIIAQNNYKMQNTPAFSIADNTWR